MNEKNISSIIYIQQITFWIFVHKKKKTLWISRSRFQNNPYPNSHVLPISFPLHVSVFHISDATLTRMIRVILTIDSVYRLFLCCKCGVIHAQKWQLPFHSLKKVTTSTKSWFTTCISTLSFAYTMSNSRLMNEEHRYTLNGLKRKNRLGPYHIDTNMHKFLFWKFPCNLNIMVRTYIYPIDKRTNDKTNNNNF